MDNYSLITSWRNTLSYQYERSGFNLGAELFYYDFSDVNMREELWTEVVISPEPAEINKESAETYGLTVSSERSYRNGFYYRLGGSLFTSDISGEIKNQYNSKYNLSLATGKEWDVAKGGKERALSVNGRVLYQGGQNYSRYMLMSSPDLIETNISPYSTAPYFRFDLRVQWTLYRGDRTSSIALDLQNAIGYENEAYKYYDSFTEKVETQYQLGLIPILAYRLEW